MKVYKIKINNNKIHNKINNNKIYNKINNNINNKIFNSKVNNNNKNMIYLFRIIANIVIRQKVIEIILKIKNHHQTYIKIMILLIFKKIIFLIKIYIRIKKISLCKLKKMHL